jgi:hypothetical protein
MPSETRMGIDRANLKRVGREEVHELSGDGSAKIHLLPPEQAGKQNDASREAPNGNRRNSHGTPYLVQPSSYIPAQ